MHEKLEFNLEYIIDEYSGYVYTVVDNLVGNSLTYQDKEEIVSDSFYLLWKYQSNIDTNLKAYLSKIARNTAYNKIRSIKQSGVLEENQELSYNPDYDNILVIKDKLNRLDIEERILFRDYYLLGLSVKEISKKMGKSVSSIKIKLYRIRKKLKEEFVNE